MIYTFGDFQLDEERYELRCVGAPIQARAQGLPRP